MAAVMHTPWKARPSGDSDGLWTVEDADGAIVFFGMDENRARLIAAAPEMLEALHEAREQVSILQYRLGIKDTGHGTLSIIDAAIAKAGA